MTKEGDGVIEAAELTREGESTFLGARSYSETCDLPCGLSSARSSILALVIVLTLFVPLLTNLSKLLRFLPFRNTRYFLAGILTSYSSYVTIGV
jgi:hypothetical protein